MQFLRLNFENFADFSFVDQLQNFVAESLDVQRRMDRKIDAIMRHLQVDGATFEKEGETAKRVKKTLTDQAWIRPVSRDTSADPQNPETPVKKATVGVTDERPRYPDLPETPKPGVSYAQAASCIREPAPATGQEEHLSGEEERGRARASSDAADAGSRAASKGAEQKDGKKSSKKREKREKRDKSRKGLPAAALQTQKIEKTPTPTVTVQPSVRRARRPRKTATPTQTEMRGQPGSPPRPLKEEERARIPTERFPSTTRS